MGFSRFFQVFLGVTLAFTIFVGAGSLLTFLLMYRMWGQPPRPTFANDDPNYKSKEMAQAKSKVAKAKPSTPKATATPTASPKPTPTLEPGAYEARVSWPEGLSIRSEPAQEAEIISGIEVNTPVVVLETSSDGVWEKIRVKATGEKGWIKAGNVEKTTGNEPEAPQAAENPPTGNPPAENPNQ